MMFTLPCAAQEGPWYETFFIETAGQYYLIPELFSELVKPDPGLRFALGYEFRRFCFAIEAGSTHITGTNPLVLDFNFYPLIFKAGYNLPIRWGLGAQADLGFGLLFSRVEHYKNAINMVRDNKLDSSSTTPLGAARLHLTYTFPSRYLKLYAGGGVDFLFENEGPIPLPLMEAGVSFSPFMLIRSVAKARVQSPAPGEIPEPVPLPQEPAVEEAEDDRGVRFFSVVYFLPDLAVLIERYRYVLDEAGERLRDNPDFRITLRGYTAPFGWTEGRLLVSADRARFCAEYLIKNYGIDEGRIKIEYFGSERVPELMDATWESYRCVELVIERTVSSE
jgi:outer membrane protein OmpA-like peptidoglycan-associated protein